MRGKFSLVKVKKVEKQKYIISKIKLPTVNHFSIPVEHRCIACKVYDVKINFTKIQPEFLGTENNWAREVAFRVKALTYKP